MDWKQVAPDFLPDGGLRDIYVLEATLLDWQAVLDAVRGFEPPPIFYTIDGMAMELPWRVDAIFENRQNARPLMSFTISGMTMNCHFFGDIDTRDGSHQIEFDL